MIEKKDELREKFNSYVNYWDGLKDEEFWSGFGLKGAFATSPFAIAPLTIVNYFIFNVEIEPSQKSLLSCLLPVWLTFGAYLFHKQLLSYQLYRKLRIIQIMQEILETDGEVE